MARATGEVLVPGPTYKPRRTPSPDRPALLDEGPHLHLDQDLLGNQGTIDLTLGGRRKPGVLGFDNPNPQLDRARIQVGDVPDVQPAQMDWTTAPREEPSRPTPTAPEPPRGVDTTAPKILPAGRARKF